MTTVDRSLAIRHPADDGAGLQDPVRVICAAPTRSGGGQPCAQQLAVIFQLFPGSKMSRLQMPSGWRLNEDGDWRVSRYAKERLKRGRHGHDRRPSAEIAQRTGNETYPGQTPKEWPYFAWCPACGQRRKFDADSLCVDAHPQQVVSPPA